MPLANSHAVLGLALGAVTGPTDPAAVVAWTGAMKPLLAFLVANTTLLPGLMVAAGSAVSGLGIFTVSGDATALATLGADMAVGAGATGAAVVSAVKGAKANASSFVAVPAGGAVSGAGLMQFSDFTVGVTIRDALGATDVPSLALWTAVGTTILSHLAAMTLVLPTPLGMTSPSGGGALVGAGSIQ